MALTGAGVSTESSIPDYRGPRGAYSTGFKPMTHQQVLPYGLPTAVSENPILRASTRFLICGAAFGGTSLALRSD